MSFERSLLIIGGLLLATLFVTIIGIWGWTQRPPVEKIKKPVAYVTMG